MTLLRLYDRLVIGLAALAAISLGLVIFGIAIDVILRNVGLRPWQATSALVEYTLLFSTMAGAPWLVRRHGHIAITSFVEMLPPGMRRAIGQLVLIVSAATLALLCWRAGAVGFDMVERGSMDIRSVNIPSWVLYAMLSAGFGLMATEFLRLFLRGELYSGGEGGH
jgi:C4-dicarboxylate transporter, DctQ subunit